MPPDPTLHLWIGQLSERVTRLERRVKAIKAQVDQLWTWGRRSAVLAAIWIGAVWTNATAEEKAQLIAAFLTALGG